MCVVSVSVFDSAGIDLAHSSGSHLFPWFHSLWSVVCVVSVSVFDSAGIDLAHPVVATCFLGSTACGL